MTLSIVTGASVRPQVKSSSVTDPAAAKKITKGRGKKNVVKNAVAEVALNPIHSESDLTEIEETIAEAASA